MISTDKAKTLVEQSVNKHMKFRFNGNRNQIEEFSGSIIKTYRAVFLIKADNEEVLKSYSYSDVFTGNLEINV